MKAASNSNSEQIQRFIIAEKIGI